MAKAKVTVGFYTATKWNSFFSAGTVISEEKFEEYVQERANELREEESYFETYLEDNYSCKEVFEMNEDEKTEVHKEYLAKCEEDARAEIEDEWDYNELNAEVEVPAGNLSKGKCPCPCNR